MRISFWRRFPSLFVAVLAAMSVAHAGAQEYPSDDQDKHHACSDLKEYIFVGGTAGFDALRHGDLFEELLRTDHVGLYQHANAIYAAQQNPGLLEDIERVFRRTGHGPAELGQVGWNYFTLPPSYGYYQSLYLQNGLSPSEANVNTPSDSAAPGQLEEDVEQWKQYVDAARTVGIETVAPIVGPNDPAEPKLGENVFATNPFYELEREEALYGKAMAFDVPPNFFLNGGAGQVTRSLLCKQSDGEMPTVSGPLCCFLRTRGPRILTVNWRLSGNSPTIPLKTTPVSLCAA